MTYARIHLICLTSDVYDVSREGLDKRIEWGDKFFSAKQLLPAQMQATAKELWTDMLESAQCSRSDLSLIRSKQIVRFLFAFKFKITDPTAVFPAYATDKSFADSVFEVFGSFMEGRVPYKKEAEKQNPRAIHLVFEFENTSLENVSDYLVKHQAHELKRQLTKVNFYLCPSSREQELIASVDAQTFLPEQREMQLMTVQPALAEATHLREYLPGSQRSHNHLQMWFLIQAGKKQNAVLCSRANEVNQHAKIR